MELSKKEQVDGYDIVNEVRKVKQKEKVVVFQPYGSGVTQQSNFIFDTSGRSFEMADAARLIDELTKDYGVVLFSQLPVSSTHEQACAWPQNLNIRQWMGVINAADYVLGCDSLGQHIAYSLGKPATVVIGSTYPENISYQDNDNFNIIDIGKEDRRYNPFRITMDDSADRNNEALMVLKDENFKEILDSIKQRLGGGSKDIKQKLGSK
jgi:ADP-heptose:LPS heptosyltransferase